MISVALFFVRNALGEKREYLQSEGYGGPLQRACDVTLFDWRKDAAVLFDADYFGIHGHFRRPRIRAFDAKTHLVW
jgi:hypothetical protein